MNYSGSSKKWNKCVAVSLKGAVKPCVPTLSFVKITDGLRLKVHCHGNLCVWVCVYLAQ